MEAEFERQVIPGEVIVVDENDNMSITTLCLVPAADEEKKKINETKPCVFELLHVASQFSIVYGDVAVGDARILLAGILARQCPVPAADVAIPVVYGVWSAAAAFAVASGIRCLGGMNRPRDVHGVLKLEPGVVKDRGVVVVDYSMSRWHLMPKIVGMVMNAGAREVHVRIASPLLAGSCHYGVDIVDTMLEKLISTDTEDRVEALRREIGCNSLAFVPLEALKELLKDALPTFCEACFSRNYPLLPPKGE